MKNNDKDDELITMTLVDDAEDSVVAEAFFAFQGKDLVVTFGDDRSAVMTLGTSEEKEVVEQFLADPNLWANFFGSLSVALKEHM